jgi:hypothetical protein
VGFVGATGVVDVVGVEVTGGVAVGGTVGREIEGAKLDD